MLPAALTVVMLLIALVGLVMWNVHLADRLNTLEKSVADVCETQERDERDTGRVLEALRTRLDKLDQTTIKKS